MFAAESRGELPKGTAETWAHHTPDIKALPEKVCKKKDHSQCKHAGAFWAAFEKTALGEIGAAGALGGLLSGYRSGRSAAGTTANALSRQGSKTKNEETARNVGKLTGAAGALGGLALGYKHKDKILSLMKSRISAHPDMQGLYHGVIPFAAGTAGGAAAGVATGAATSLRGAFSHKKEAFWKGFVKEADSGGMDGGGTGMSGTGKGQLGSSNALTIATGTMESQSKTDHTLLDRDRNPRDFSPNDIFGPILEEDNGSHILY